MSGKRIILTRNVDAVLRAEKALCESGLIEPGDYVQYWNVPEEDEHGRPILAFVIDCGRLWYWAGEPFSLPSEDILKR